MTINRNAIYDSLDDKVLKSYFTMLENIFNQIADTNSIAFVNFLISLNNNETRLEKFSNESWYRKEIIENLVESVMDILENKTEIEEDFELEQIKKLPIIKRIAKIYAIDVDSILDVFDELGYDYEDIKEINKIIPNNIHDNSFITQLKETDESLVIIFENESENIIF